MFDDWHPSIMFATMAIFLAMIVILNTFLYKPLLQYMDNRDDSIKKDENTIKEYSQEMLDAGDEIETIHASTREEIYKIKQNAINTAKEEAEKVMKAKKEELERKMTSFYTELESQKRELQEHLSMHLPSLKQALQNNIKQY